MKKSHTGFWVSLAFLFIAAVYSAIVFLVKPAFDLGAWLLYGFTMASFLLTMIAASASARSGTGIVMNGMHGAVTSIYFGIQFLFGGILCMCFSELPTTPVLVCEIILLGAYLAVSFVIYGAQSHMSAQDANDQRAVRKLRMLESDVQGMADRQTDAKLKMALQGLADDIHYSDVVSLPGLTDVEWRIGRNVAMLEEDLADARADPFARIETIRQLLKERDRVAAIQKQ